MVQQGDIAADHAHGSLWVWWGWVHRKLGPRTIASRLLRRSAREVRQVIQWPLYMIRIWRVAIGGGLYDRRSGVQLLREQLLLQMRHGITPESYHKYHLYDPKLAREDKKNYLPVESSARAKQLWSLLEVPAYRCLYFNKLLFNQYFGSQGLRVANLYAVYDPMLGYTVDGRSLKNVADLRDWLATSGPAEFVIKPVEGDAGKQILVFAGRSEDDSSKRVTLGGDIYDAKRLATFMETDISWKDPEYYGLNRPWYLIEQRIHQHPELAALLGETLCTLRVQTIIARDGRPQIIAAVFKAQPNPVGVDHLIYGAVGAWVDLDTGVLGQARSRFSTDYTSVLPGSDVSFVGFQLPCWAEVRQMALRAASTLPWMRSIGWDIGISEQGPVLIEGNVGWSPSLIQMPAPHGLLRGEFRALYEALRRGEEL